MNLFVDHDPFAILVSEYNQPKEDFAVYVAGCQLAFGCRTEKDGARTASITVGTAGTVTITFTTNSAPKLLQTCLFKGSDVFLDDGAEGFLVLAPDALTPLGGTPDDISKGPDMIRQLDGEKTTKNFVAAVKYLKTHPLCTGKVGCTGFCWGGAMTNQVAVNSPDLDAAVPYYGRPPADADVEKIKAPLMAHFAGNDDFINPGIPAFEEALKKFHKEYQIFMYPGAQHAFNNDSNKERYNAEAAKLAWGRTIGFFKEKLK